MSDSKNKETEPILNRVANSTLVTFNLEDYYPEGERKLLDIKDWLYKGIILKEKEFRAQLDQHPWEQYKDAFVAISCSSDAIIPGWAYMLITTRLHPYARKIVNGSIEDLETTIYQSVIENLDVSHLSDKSVIIKGCTTKPVPPNAYLWATSKIQSVARSVMYGEACSSVPLFKKSR